MPRIPRQLQHPASFKGGPLPHDIPVDSEFLLYVVAQKSMDNVATHARAESIWIVRSAERGRITLQVIDSSLGSAFEYGVAALGIHGMAERTRIAR